MKKIITLSLIIAASTIAIPTHGMFVRAIRTRTLHNKPLARKYASHNFNPRISPRWTLKNGRVAPWSPQEQFLDRLDFDSETSSERFADCFDLAGEELIRKAQKDQLAWGNRNETSTENLQRKVATDLVLFTGKLVLEHEATYFEFMQLPQETRDDIVKSLKEEIEKPKKEALAWLAQNNQFAE